MSSHVIFWRPKFGRLPPSPPSDDVIYEQPLMQQVRKLLRKYIKFHVVFWRKKYASENKFRKRRSKQSRQISTLGGGSFQFIAILLGWEGAQSISLFYNLEKKCKNLIRIPVLDNCKRSPLSNFVLHYTWKTPKRSRFILHKFSSPRPLFKIIFWCIHPTQWHLFCIFLLLPLAPGRNCPETCRCLKKITCGQMI